MLELFDMQYLSVLARIIESDEGENMKISGNAISNLARAKSLVNQKTVSPLIENVFRIIFIEINRYLDILSKVKGIDWSIYLKNRQSLAENGLLDLEKVDGKVPSIEEILLLD